MKSNHLILIAFTCLMSACASKVTPPGVVPTVDLQKYSGCWYEIATIPMFVQRGCVGTTAQYLVKDTKTIHLINRCYTESLSGSLQQVEGDATIVDQLQPAKLSVSFDSWWGVFARGDYWIVLLDPKYQYAVVSGPTRKRLWILSRTPQLPTITLESIRTKLKKQGFDLTELKMTQQYPEIDICGAHSPTNQI